ncbi:Methyl-CpG-binding domain-containing protein 7 [Sesamum angolense]|uniref:Methyl-CpG-binding domain-containing protein 7 n=1 Tax=Sesamum angolense TaxID=2727404 RepID=A0AAE2C504_9LAMI|nr:Methyl-CpG-binding domain-containing protein 7 [Sesamum angolense]
MEEQRHHSTLSPSNSMLVPYAHRHLPLSSPSASRFRIPRGWGVEEVPRHDGSRSDMYYYEPGTGRKFRSIREVQRYLNGDSYPFRSTRKLSLRSQSSGYRRMLFSGEKSSRCRRMIVSGGKLLRLDNELSQSHLAITASQMAAPAAPFVLPDGWIVEEVPQVPIPGCCREVLDGIGRNEPLSKALEEMKENKPLSKIFKLENHAKHSSPRKKNISRENTQASSFVSPPLKVNWVLASPRGDAWNPFISEALVPDSVKQQWSNRFVLFMNDGSGNLQSSRE